MKRRIYFSLLISAIAGLVWLGAGVPKGHTVQGHNQTIPEAWRGTWEVTVAYRDQETGVLVATDVTTAEICPGEPVIPPPLNTYVRCADEATANAIGVSCHNIQRMVRHDRCEMFWAADLISQRNGDSWNGTGSWSLSFVGECTQTSHAEDLVVSGTRISTVAACNGQASSLLQRFFAHSRLVPFLEGSN
ncbi:MAG: hypothetical protein ND895_01755 [Pyrinomonadaceae bacterium]|nr:hypothetical protein [Pyrinomonadaceae bacterium]